MTEEIIELKKQAQLLKENSANLRFVIEKWLMVLEDGNKKFAEQQLFLTELQNL